MRIFAALFSMNVEQFKNRTAILLTIYSLTLRQQGGL